MYICSGKIEKYINMTVLSIVSLALMLMVGVTTAAPHILVLMLDDIGRTDTGIYGESNINLPTLKNLASEGVVFENLYTQPVCSPTRTSFLTGLYPFRFGMQHTMVSCCCLFYNVLL